MKNWSIVPGVVSYLMASMAGAATIMIYLGVAKAAQGGAPDWSDIANFGVLVAVGTAIFALIPSLIALVILRVLRQSGLLAYLFAGLAVGLCVQLIFFQRGIEPSGVQPFGWDILLGGAVAGLAYWATMKGLAKLTALAA